MRHAAPSKPSLAARIDSVCTCLPRVHRTRDSIHETECTRMEDGEEIFIGYVSQEEIQDIRATGV